MKKILTLICVIAAVFCLGGCSMELTFDVKKNGKCDVGTKMFVTSKDYSDFCKFMASATDDVPDVIIPENLSDNDFEEMLKQSGTQYEVTKVNGEKTYVITENAQLDSASLAKSASEEATISPTAFVLSMSKAEQPADLSDFPAIISEEQIDYLMNSLNIVYVVNMPNEIVLTNGELSNGNKTVTFDFAKLANEKKIYAYAKGAQEIVEFNGVDGKYIKAKKVALDTVDKVKKITVNGKTVSGKMTFSAAEDGQYKVVAKTANSTIKQTFIKDTKAPTIKGVKNKKTYKKAVTIKFSDATSGIKSATLNGKKIKSGKKVKKNGTYTLVITDKAGNSKTVKFTIKK